ncbi:hypothetical protein CU097_008415, partial [Rhizopus azygosporus]
MVTDKIDKWYKRRNEGSYHKTTIESISYRTDIYKQTRIYSKISYLVQKLHSFALD